MSCSVYSNVSIPTFSVAVLLTIGIFASYLPQHLNIVRRKTSEGLSPIFLLLGSTSGCSAFLNLLLLTSLARECCHIGLTLFQCLNSQLGLVQVGVQFISYSLIPVLLVIYTRGSITQSPKDYHEIEIVLIIFGIYTLVNLSLAIYFLHNQHHLYSFANYSGVISSVLSGIQYFPQIYTTYKLKHAGSLSISMMLMQTPGGFLWTLTLFLLPNSKWSSWLPYFTAATLQGFLLGMCIYYQFHSLKNQEQEAIQSIVAENVDEHTSLL